MESRRRGGVLSRASVPLCKKITKSEKTLNPMGAEQVILNTFQYTHGRGNSGRRLGKREENNKMWKKKREEEGKGYVPVIPPPNLAV